VPRRRAKSSDRDALEWEAAKSQRERVEWEQKQEADRRSRLADKRDLRYKRLTAAAAGLALVTSIGVGVVNFRTSESALRAAQANLEIAEGSGALPVAYSPSGSRPGEWFFGVGKLNFGLRNEGRSPTDIAQVQAVLFFTYGDGVCQNRGLENSVVATTPEAPLNGAILEGGRSMKATIYFSRNTGVPSPCLETADYEVWLHLTFGNGCEISAVFDGNSKWRDVVPVDAEPTDSMIDKQPTARETSCREGSPA
jgi:hypothetical protein